MASTFSSGCTSTIYTHNWNRWHIFPSKEKKNSSRWKGNLLGKTCCRLLPWAASASLSRPTTKFSKWFVVWVLKCSTSKVTGISNNEYLFHSVNEKTSLNCCAAQNLFVKQGWQWPTVNHVVHTLTMPLCGTKADYSSKLNTITLLFVF